ncbi:MAG: GNAT family protein [Lachnospiraceae bacterium]|nr:GNAT family protein [Lachnospiraceae bacterium]MDY5742120.1 GNAT family protein [Lachnospiraceae bacterium]
MEVTFRLAEPEDAAFLYQLMNEDQQYQSCQPRSLAEIETELQEGGYRDEYLHIYVVESDAQAIGLLYLYQVREGLMRIGLHLIKQQRGRGIGSRLLRLAADHVFSNRPTQRLEADTDVDNEMCKSAFEAAGFRAEAVLRQFRFHHGSWHDSILFVLLRDEWSGIKS